MFKLKRSRRTERYSFWKLPSFSGEFFFFKINRSLTSRRIISTAIPPGSGQTRRFPYEFWRQPGGRQGVLGVGRADGYQVKGGKWNSQWLKKLSFKEKTGIIMRIKNSDSQNAFSRIALFTV